MRNRILENAKEFQAANKHVAEQSFELLPGGFPRDFVMELGCECVNRACSERVRISYDDYMRCLRQEDAFVVVPWHYLPEFEWVARTTPEYWIIIKRPEKTTKPFEL